MHKNRPAFLLALLLLAAISPACKREEIVPAEAFSCTGVRIGSKVLTLNNPWLNLDVQADQPIAISLNYPAESSTLVAGIQLVDQNEVNIPLTFTLLDARKTVLARPTAGLAFQQRFTLRITNMLKSEDWKTCTPLETTFTTRGGTLNIDSVVAGNVKLVENALENTDVPLNFTAKVRFNHAINPTTVTAASVKLNRKTLPVPLQFSFENQDSTLVIKSTQPIVHYDKYTLSLTAAVLGSDGSVMTDYSRTFYSALDPNPKFPVVSDNELLDLVQRQTFKYFWDFGHPVSGLARERNASGDIVTSGGSGFGVMSIIVGIERGFITRAEGVARWKKIVSFLKNTSQRYHGAWPHWLNGANGTTVPFSTKDNGADLVETSYLIQGLLTVRQYLNDADTEEAAIKGDIQYLWETVEWDWFTRGGQNVLYWHWSPNYQWEMNHQIKGYNECLITYFLAACSPTHPISANVYKQGWASSGQIINNKDYYGINLPLGFAFGGPLFFAHYSFLGLDPRNLKDTYANYMTQNTNHTLINQAHCINNPLKKVGYNAECWGLTASDNHIGYNAHSPTNDLGVITPTAALSSFPYTPTESMAALKFFYYKLGDKLWGQYGFYDAFNVTEGWYGNTFLAIDQGPIIVMIENQRSAKLWNLFMSSPEVATGATLLGFTY